MIIVRPIVFLALITLAGCSTEEIVVCSNRTGGIKVAGFDSTSIRRAELRSFVGNGRFDMLHDTFAYTLDIHNMYFESGVAVIPDVIYIDTFDYELSLPYAGAVYRISGIKRQPQHSETFRTGWSKVGHQCANRFTTYTLNGVEQQWEPADQQYITLHK